MAINRGHIPNINMYTFYTVLDCLLDIYRINNWFLHINRKHINGKLELKMRSKKIMNYTDLAMNSLQIEGI